MKTVIAIYIIAVITGVYALDYANKCIDDIVASADTVQVMIEPVPPLVIPDTGYNSAADLLQTAAGPYVYQRANYAGEFLQ